MENASIKTNHLIPHLNNAGITRCVKVEENTCCNLETGFRELDYILLPSTRLFVHLGVSIWQYSMNLIQICDFSVG